MRGFATGRNFVVLEPDAMKVASPVLRGGWFSNELSLPSCYLLPCKVCKANLSKIANQLP